MYNVTQPLNPTPSGCKGDDAHASRHRHHPQPDLAKAVPLGNALLVFLAVPWALCALFYTGLHFTYPRDKRRAAMEELQQGGGASATGEGEAASSSSVGRRPVLEGDEADGAMRLADVVDMQQQQRRATYKPW